MTVNDCSFLHQIGGQTGGGAGKPAAAPPDMDWIATVLRDADGS